MRHRSAASALLTLILSVPAAAQTVLDWPLVLEARPAPLVAGSGALLANPAGITGLARRAEALVSDLETPDEMGLRALTIAGAVRVLDDWTLGAAYRHVGVGDMLRTDGPPIGGSPRPLEIGEDVFALGVGARFGSVSAGAAARLDTPAEDLRGDESWAGAVGARYTPELPLGALRLAASLELDEEPTIAAAAEFVAPPLLDERLALALAWGTRQNGPLGLSHSVVGSGTWLGLAELQVDTSAQPDAADRQWVPLLAALLHLGRYRLGVVREHLPNGFGAATHYRLSVVF